MFITKDLIYLELQKTGGTHIRKLLKQISDGEPDGKHNRLLADPGGKSVIGSVRNPWDWYVSLWAYGAGGRGAVRARTTKGIDLDYYYRMLPKTMGKNFLTVPELVTNLYHDFMKPCPRWQQTYLDSVDAVLFRDWLKLLFDKRRRFDIGEGYGFSPLSQHAGLLTYRYFRLFTQGDGVFRNRGLASPEAVHDYDVQNNILSDTIRMESLEEDFIRIIENAGVALTDDQLSVIKGKGEDKTNTSIRKPMSHYYDDETIDLVAEGDAYLIGKYGYQPPD